MAYMMASESLTSSVLMTVSIPSFERTSPSRRSMDSAKLVQGLSKLPTYCVRQPLQKWKHAKVAKVTNYGQRRCQRTTLNSPHYIATVTVATFHSSLDHASALGTVAHLEEVHLTLVC